MKFFLNVLLLMLLALPLAVLAQDEMQAVDLGDGYTITVPADWDTLRVKNGEYSLGNGTTTLRVMTPTRLQALNINFPADSNVVDVLGSLTFPFEGVQLESGDATKTRANDRQAATYTNTDGASSDELYTAVTLSNGAFGYLSFAAAKGELDALQPLIDEITASFDGSAEVAPAGTASCTISTDQANTAQLRVGPGTNRGAISFLPTGTDVTVTGRIELEDGSVWYQLDKAQAAPNGSPAAELWVAAESITESGSCASVGDTNAPPIIPISVAPPPQTNDQPGGEQPNPQPSGDTGSAGAGALPNPGRWTMTYNPTTNVSCQGTPNYPMNSSEVFASMSYTYFLDGVDANSFRYAGDLYTRAGGSNSFNGSWTYEDGDNAQVRLDVISPTTMGGQLVGNGTYEGTPCSFTVQIIVTRTSG